MRFIFSILCWFVLVFGLSAQTNEGLVAFYNFNDTTVNEQLGSGANGISINNLEYVCGVDGLALKLNGGSDEVLFAGVISNYFDDDDFTLGFFMNPVSNMGDQTIFSKKSACDDEKAFAIRYSPSSNTLTVEISQNPSKKVSLSAILDFDKCWQHITVVREGGTIRLFVNGFLEKTGSTLSRIDLDGGTGVFGLAAGPCIGITDNRFGGVIDEVRLYDRALKTKEVEGLYVPLIPDNIITSDTTVFLGNDVQILSGNTCADVVSWFPSDNLSDASITEPLISPVETTVYDLTFIDALSCVTTDSIRITVINPDDLDCSKVFLPNAFTPNGDGRNDTYGISNPYAVMDLQSFEIFDRWGGRVFLTSDPMQQWDGSFKGQPMNPGVLLYKVIFRCDGEELVNVGSLSIIR